MGYAPTESQIQRAILAQLQVCHIPAWRANTGAFATTYKGQARFIRFGPKGQADIIGVLPPTGRMLCVEVKRLGEQPRPAQRLFLQAIAEAGGLALVLHSAAELMTELGRAGWARP